MIATIYHRYRRVIVFILVGGLTALFGGLQMYLYVEVLRIDQNLAYAFQTFVSLQINFNMNDRWTWGEVRAECGSYWHRLVKYHAARLTTTVFCLAVFSLLVNYGTAYMVAYGVDVLLGFAINYVTSIKFVFRKVQ